MRRRSAVTPCLAEYFGSFGVQPQRCCRARAEGEEMRAARLQELQEMAAKLVATARKLPPSQERHEALQEIRNIRARIDELKAKGK